MENCKLPRELLIEILARLPVTSLMRVKSVCKFFYSLIKSDNHFQHKHYEISRVRRDYVIFQREIGIREFPLWREEVFGLVYKELDSDEIGCVDLVMPSLGIVKCIDGILCLIALRTDGTRNILIWNPSTREIKALPPISPPHNFLSDQSGREVIGFGFCNNMTGKVVIVWSSLDGFVYKVKVCSQDARKLERLYCHPVQRLVADCILMDVDTAAVSDRKGSVAILSCSNHSKGKLLHSDLVLFLKSYSFLYLQLFFAAIQLSIYVTFGYELNLMVELHFHYLSSLKGGKGHFDTMSLLVIWLASYILITIGNIGCEIEGVIGNWN